MPKIAYTNAKCGQEAQRMVEICNRFIASYMAKGYKLTLRQLYYRIVASDQFPPDRRWVQTSNKKWVRHSQGTINAEPNYTWLGKIVSEARLAGLIDWLAIEDRGRYLQLNNHWTDPAHRIKSAAQSYHTDLWLDQEYRPEVFVEKDALSGVLESACAPLDVPFFACKGYTSQSAMWEAGQRLLGYIREGKTPIIFHLGDHDPSGIDMSRDIQERLEMFIGESLEFRRIALNMNQIEENGAPPNPAKTTDARFETYRKTYGDESWELDALEPEQLVELIQTNLKEIMNVKRFNAAVQKMESERKDLEYIAENYESAVVNAKEFEQEMAGLESEIAEEREEVKKPKRKKATKKRRKS
jgi:exonuclease VII small subunit